jgi:hypothetical protein
LSAEFASCSGGGDAPVKRVSTRNAVKCVPADVNVADLDFDPEDPTSQNTY